MKAFLLGVASAVVPLGLLWFYLYVQSFGGLKQWWWVQKMNGLLRACQKCPKCDVSDVFTAPQTCKRHRAMWVKLGEEGFPR